MSQCTDKKFQKMLAEYELELLSPEDREAFELHLLSCDACFETVRGFVNESMHLIHSPEVREIVQQAIVDQAQAGIAPRTAESPRSRRFWLIPSLAGALIVAFLVLNPWQIVFRPTDEALSSEPRLAVLPISNQADVTDSLSMGAAATQLLITDLADSRTVSVVSEKSMQSILNMVSRQPTSVKDNNVASSVARQSKSRWVLSGTVVSEAPSLQIDVILLDVDHQDTVVNRQVTCGSEAELFCVVDSITSTIRQHIQPLVGSTGKDRPVAEITTFSEKAYLQFVRGVDLYRQFLNDQAATRFRAAIALDSNFAMAWYYLALTTGNRSYITAAMRNIDHVSRREQFWIRSWDALWSGDTTRYFQQLHQLVQEYPDEEEAWHWMGVIEQQRGELRAAEPYYLEALKINPLFERSYNQLSYLYADLGDYNKAMWAAEKNIELVPDEPNPYDSRGEIFQRFCKIDSAIALYRKALAVNPDFTPSITKLANLLLLTGHAEEADSLYGGVNTPISKLRTAYLVTDLGSTLVARGLLDSAVAYTDHRLKEVWSECDSSDQASIAQLLEAQKALILAETDVHKAAEEMSDALAPRGMSVEKPQTNMVYHFLRLELDASNQSVIVELMKKLEADSSAAREKADACQFARGCLLLMDGAPDSASSVFGKLLTGNGTEKNVAVVDLLMRSYLLSHQPGKAIKVAEQTLCSPAPDRIHFPSIDIRIHYLLAQAYSESGQTRMARTEYQLILDRWAQADQSTPLVEDVRNKLAALNAS